VSAAVSPAAPADRDAVGRRIAWTGEVLKFVGISGDWRTVVGVVGNTKDGGLDAASLPLRYAGFSPSYRREAGSHGKDTRGIWRVHWFDKVEMFSYCAPDEAAAEHARLLAWEQEFLGKLELPYRVIDVATDAIETPEQVARVIGDVLKFVPKQRIVACTNCGMAPMRRDIAEAKLMALGAGAALARKQFG